MVLYIFLWLPGLIANIAYIHSAADEKRRTGVVPNGVGCLRALLWVGLAPLVLVAVLVVLAIMGGAFGQR
jgi:hypothetical protein